MTAAYVLAAAFVLVGRPLHALPQHVADAPLRTLPALDCDAAAKGGAATCWSSARRRTPLRPIIAQTRVPVVQVGVRVQPETVTVGDQFTLIVRVRAPAGAVIAFPSSPDSGAVELVGQAQFTEPRAAGAWVEQIAGYRLAAWDVGAQPIRIADVVVRVGAGERRVPLGGTSVFVKSVLPADTSLHVPKPARALYALALPWWVWLILAILAAIALGWLLWWIWKKYRAYRDRALPPYERALRDFERIEAMKLPERDEGARHIALMADVMRAYLVATVEETSSSHTTTELLHALRASPDAKWDSSMLARTEQLLERVDLAKFARWYIPPDEARSLGGEARQIVWETERRRAGEEERKAA